MKKIILIVIGLLVAGGLYWQFNPAKAKKVETVKAQTMPAVQAVYATGTVEAVKMIAIAPKISARLMALMVDEGAQVKAGDVLAQLEDADVEGALKELVAKQELARKDLKRAQTLAKSGAISKEGLEQAQSAFKAASASVERSTAELGYLKLMASEDGTIIRRDGEMGEMIPSGKAVFWMSAGDAMRIETEVDEEDISLVKVGQKVLISADAYPQEVFHGAVQSITPKGDPVARSYRVRVSIEESTPLMIGMTAETNIITSKKNSALMIPSTALKEGKIMIVENRKAKTMDVQTGIKSQNEVEILSSLPEDASIVKNYSAELLDEKHVSPSNVSWKNSASE